VARTGNRKRLRTPDGGFGRWDCIAIDDPWDAENLIRARLSPVTMESDWREAPQEAPIPKERLVFEFAQLLGDGERGIALQTHLGRDIPNAVGAEITDYNSRRFQLIVERHGQSWVIRKEPAPGYNCGGHVWASRRTCIYDLDPAWSMILADDGYRQTDHPQPDDLVFYLDEDRRVLHSAASLNCTPVYRRSPSGYPGPLASGRTGRGKWCTACTIIRMTRERIRP
jgi:hypothetical protein